MQPAPSVVATARRADRLDDLVSDCGEGMEAIAGDISDAHFRGHDDLAAQQDQGALKPPR
jgi:hypothetical protein